ncbi:MAG: GTPase ObgE [Bacteroidetes bacterium]|nr:GTPase ObgE [Bacteroidota bacterium]
MEGPNFIDYVKILCKSGKGGAGSVHFRRDKYTAKGGPDGGDGGRGGNIVVKGNKQLWTLLHLKYHRHATAKAGINGGKSNMTGAEGEDVYLEVPLGTIAINEKTGKQEFEIIDDGQTEILVPGGRGGLGNAHFKTSTRQAPKFAQPGEDGKEGLKILELKLLADVGLVGHPNAGKSTLLATVSKAKPKIAEYEFTTLTPSVGIVEYKDYQSFVMADIPGIIEGASEGKGLGLRFLRHIERNSILLFMVPVDTKDVIGEFKILLNELNKHNPEILVKEKLLAITKIDLIDGEMKEELTDIMEKETGNKGILKNIPYIFISSITEEGIPELKDLIWKTLN